MARLSPPLSPLEVDLDRKRSRGCSRGSKRSDFTKMRHAWSQPAHARAHPPPSSSSAAPWAASSVPPPHLAHAAAPASAYPPLGATHADIATQHNSHGHHAGAGGRMGGAGVANASTALERVLAMLDGFEVSSHTLARLSGTVLELLERREGLGVAARSRRRMAGVAPGDRISSGVRWE